MKHFLPLLAMVIAGCSRQATVTTPTPLPPSPGTTPPPSALDVRARATINDVASSRIGSATFTDTPAGLMVTITVTGLGIGAHAVHLHTVGACQGPAFSSAGAHFNPAGRQHGFRNSAGHHAGDMPNLISPPAGAYAVQFVLGGVKLTGRGGLLDDDGASIVIHSSEDDHVTDPSGNSGGRLACGVINPVR
ncbi:MAG TPA: superoxide dismutase family protein [Gemmatimonadaceae bacterium]|nr:superoxide dismutase family protein [Gemmatimonadaceae bacterium]